MFCVRSGYALTPAKHLIGLSQRLVQLFQARQSPRALTKPELESQRLNIGPAGKLLVEKKLKSVRSCEDFTLFEENNPFDENGKPRDVPEKTREARETFIVNQIVKGKEKLSVVILGGAHDLSDNVPKGVRLIEVTVKAYRDFVD